jgi:uncharacterized membrane protein
MITWIHLVHVLSAMVWVGGGLTLMLIGARARSSPDVNAIGQFARTLPYVGLRVLMPAVVLVLVTGVWLVMASASWNFSQFWVLLALGLFALAFLIGAVYLSRVGIELERTASAEALASAKEASLVNRWLLGYGVVLGALLLAVWDMVFKPRL